MRVIDLAEKQRNNEILPKHIRYENEDLYFDGVAYCDKEGNNDFLDILAMNNSTLTHLFDEVEIIEEEQDIEELGDYDLTLEETLITRELELTYEGISKTIGETRNKINELVREVNKLKGGKNENDERNV